MLRHAAASMRPLRRHAPRQPAFSTGAPSPHVPPRIAPFSAPRLHHIDHCARLTHSPLPTPHIWQNVLRHRNRSTSRPLSTSPSATSSVPSPPPLPSATSSKQTTHTDTPSAPTISSDNIDGAKSFSKVAFSDFSRLLSLAKPESKLLSAAAGLLLVSSAVSLSVPLCFGKIIDFFTNQSVADLPLSMPTVAGLLAAVFLVGASANTIRVIIMRIAGQRIIQRLRIAAYESTLRADIAWHDTKGAGAGGKGTGDLVSRLGSDTVIVGDSITRELADAARSLVTAVAGMGMMLYLSVKLTCLMLLVVPPTAIGAVFFGRYLKKLSKMTQEAVGAMIHVAEERLNAITTVQAFNAVPREKSRFSDRADAIFTLAKKEAYASGLFFGGSGFSGNATLIALLTYGGHLVSKGEISVGALSSLMLYTAYIGSSLVGLTSFFSTIMKGLGASSRVFELLDARPVSVVLGVGRNIDSSEPLKKVFFKDVTFDYPSRPDINILNAISLSIEPGSSVAIAGGSGSGKSTLANLLLRYYDPKSGQVLYGDEDIRNITPESWRERIALVPQDPALFGGTIRDNILYGNPPAAASEVEEAARLANALGFISSLPLGFETQVGPRGTQLSGGQRQRLAIARALVRQPALLVLDEATSALDAASEAEVNLAIQQVTASRSLTTIMIAHRLSTLKTADQIVFMEGGQVKEIGSYEELAQDGTAFNAMVRSQLLGVGGSSTPLRSPSQAAEIQTNADIEGNK